MTAVATYTQQTRRLMSLLAYAKAHPGTSAPNMAAAAGVSRPTLYRMLGTLQDAFGAIVESRGGHYYLQSAGVIKLSKVLDNCITTK